MKTRQRNFPQMEQVVVILLLWVHSSHPLIILLEGCGSRPHPDCSILATMAAAAAVGEESGTGWSSSSWVDTYTVIMWGGCLLVFRRACVLHVSSWAEDFSSLLSECSECLCSRLAREQMTWELLGLSAPASTSAHIHKQCQELFCFPGSSMSDLCVFFDGRHSGVERLVCSCVWQSYRCFQHVYQSHIYLDNSKLKNLHHHEFTML